MQHRMVSFIIPDQMQHARYATPSGYSHDREKKMIIAKCNNEIVSVVCLCCAAEASPTHYTYFLGL